MNLIPKVFAQAQPVISIDQPDNVRIDQIGTLISAIVSALLVIAALLAFLYLVLGGIQWITSGGDKSGMEAARNKITQAIVGLVIVAAAYAIMILISNFLGISLSSLEIQQPF